MKLATMLSRPFDLTGGVQLLVDQAQAEPALAVLRDDRERRKLP